MEPGKFGIDDGVRAKRWDDARRPSGVTNRLMIAQRIEGRIGGGEDFETEALVKSAGQELWIREFCGDGVEVVVCGFRREALVEAEELLKGVVEPHAGGRSAEEVVVVGEDTPDAARIFDLGHADFEVLERDALAVEHSIDVVVGLNEELGGIRERLVVREPCGLRVTVRADDGEVTDLGIETACDAARLRVGGKEPVIVQQRCCRLTFSNFQAVHGHCNTSVLDGMRSSIV